MLYVIDFGFFWEVNDHKAYVYILYRTISECLKNFSVVFLVVHFTLETRWVG